MKRIPQSTIPSEGPTMGSRVPGHGQRLGWESLQPWSGKGAKEAGSYMLLQLGRENAY